MKLLLADENFPYPSFRFLLEQGYDIKHIITTDPSIMDESVIRLAQEEKRLILTFDSDFGQLIFQDAARPPGVIYFRWTKYRPDEPGRYLHKLFAEAALAFEGYLTVIGEGNIRQKKIP